MTPSQIAAVQDSFVLVLSIREPFARLFYLRLFDIDPSTRGLFKGDPAEQRQKLMSALTMAVRALSNLRAILPVLENLARRHVQYGVQESHYDSVGTALLWTLRTTLGEGFSDEAHDGWSVAYTSIAGAMIEATKRAERAA